MENIFNVLFQPSAWEEASRCACQRPRPPDRQAWRMPPPTRCFAMPKESHCRRHRKCLPQAEFEPTTALAIFRQSCAAAIAEYVISFIRMFGRSEPRHIFNNAEHRHIHLVALKHAYALARIGQRHFLRSCHYDGAGDGQRLHKRQMDVARSRRHVDYKIVERAPIGLAYQLFECIACHAAAPKHSTVFVYQNPIDSNRTPYFSIGTIKFRPSDSSK